MAETPVTPTPDVVVKVENSVVSAVKNVWAKVEELDSTLNAWVTKVTNGHTTLAIMLVAVAYWLLPVKAILEFVLQVPALTTKYILLALAVAVPALIDAVPYMIGVVLALLAIVEVKNLLKKIVK